jgi:carbon storage regulator
MESPEGDETRRISSAFPDESTPGLHDREVRMLVLTRREGERIAIGESICLTVVSIQGNKVRLGIQAPENTSIKRGELLLDVSDSATVQHELIEQA